VEEEHKQKMERETFWAAEKAAGRWKPPSAVHSIALEAGKAKRAALAEKLGFCVQ